MLRRLAFVSALLLIVPSCGSRSYPVAPNAPAATLENIWPSTEGLLWTYTSVGRGWDTTPLLAVYSDPALVPPVTFDTVAAVLAARPAGTNATRDSSQLQLIFSSEIDLPTGIRVRTLFELPVGTTAAGRFLHGGFWKRTSNAIVTYSTFDTVPDWKFLEGNLAPGSTFSFMLIPDLAPDVLVHGKVVRSLSVSTPGGVVANAVEVHYYADFGISEMTDDQGNSIGSARQFACGSVIYAPGVGPVRDDERGGLFAGQALRPGFGDLLISLIDGPRTTSYPVSHFER